MSLTSDRVVTLNLKAPGLKQRLMRLLTAVGSNKIQENLMSSDLSVYLPSVLILFSIGNYHVFNFLQSSYTESEST